MLVSEHHMKRRHFSRNYRIISVMFWAFPYLLWQAFGHWSGFIVGVIVAVVLTAMFNSLFFSGNGDRVSARSSQMAELPAREQAGYREEAGQYQRGYRGEERSYHAEFQADQAETFQIQYEEMQVPYPEEIMPPMEQK